MSSSNIFVLPDLESVERPPRRPYGRVTPACDLCHQKKIRCDRRNPCSNCVLTSKPCIRSRQRQVSRRGTGPNQSQQQDVGKILDRMARLEESLQQSRSEGTATHGSRTSISASGASLGSPEDRHAEMALDTGNDKSTSMHPRAPPLSSSTRSGTVTVATAGRDDLSRGRVRVSASEHEQTIESPGTETDNGLTPEDKALAEVDLRRYLDPNMDSRGTMDLDKQELLMSALALAKQMPISEPRSWETNKASVSYLNFYQSNSYPSADFLCLMLSETTKSTAATYYFELNANGSISKLEEMARALLDCSVHGETRILYIICVNYMAYSFLTSIDVDECNSFRMELARVARERYRDNVNMALHHLDTRPRADPLLLQALVSAAMIMQDTGNMQQCWQLNRVACRVAALLSGSWITNHQKSLHPRDTFEIRLNFMKCYIYDRALSSSFNHPTCGIDVDLETSILNTEKPSHAMLLIMVETAKIHNIINKETRNFGKAGGIDAEKMRSQVQNLKEIMKQAGKFRSNLRDSEDRYLLFEWEGIDFMYHSTMTSIIRLSTTDGRFVLQSCVQHARDCLSALKAMLEISSSASPYRNKCLTSIAWLVPLFTLRPIFFLFRRVVATSDALDLRLIQDVSNGLKPFSKTHHSVLIIERLCSTLVDLYEKFADKVIYKRKTAGMDRGDVHDLEPLTEDKRMPGQDQAELAWLPPIPPFNPAQTFNSEDMFDTMMNDVLGQDSFWEPMIWQPPLDWSELEP